MTTPKAKPKEVAEIRSGACGLRIEREAFYSADDLCGMLPKANARKVRQWFAGERSTNDDNALKPLRCFRDGDTALVLGEWLIAFLCDNAPKHEANK